MINAMSRLPTFESPPMLNLNDSSLIAYVRRWRFFLITRRSRFPFNNIAKVFARFRDFFFIFLVLFFISRRGSFASMTHTRVFKKNVSDVSETWQIDFNYNFMNKKKPFRWETAIRRRSTFSVASALIDFDWYCVFDINKGTQLRFGYLIRTIKKNLSSKSPSWFEKFLLSRVAIFTLLFNLLMREENKILKISS